MEENRRLKEEIASLKHAQELTKHAQELIKELPRLLFEVKALTEKVKSTRRGESHRSKGSTAPLSSKENIIVATPVLSTARDHNTLKSTNLFKDEKVLSPETHPDAVERKAARKFFSSENKRAGKTGKENRTVTAQIQDEAAGGKIRLEDPMPLVEGDTNSGETTVARLSDFIGKDGQILDESLILQSFDAKIMSIDSLEPLNISAVDFQVIEEKVVPLDNGKTTTILHLVDQNKASGSCAGPVEKSQTMGEACDVQPQAENGVKNPEDKSKLVSKPILTMKPAPVYNEQDIFKFGSKTLAGRELHGCKHNGSIRVLAADVFRLLFTDEEMALGSLSGKAPNAHKNFVPKSTLDAARIDGIVDYITVFLTNSIARSIVEKEVKRGITQKLNNFNKSSAAKTIHEKHLQKLKENPLAAAVAPNAGIA